MKLVALSASQTRFPSTFFKFQAQSFDSYVSDMAQPLSLGSYTSRWLDKIFEPLGFSKSFRSSSSNLKAASNLFALSKFVKNFRKLFKGMSELKLEITRPKASIRKVSSKTLQVTCALSSGVSSLAKTIEVADCLYPSSARLPAESRAALAETASCAGFVFEVLDLAKASCSMHELRNPGKISELKKQSIKEKKTSLSLDLVCKTASVAAGTLSFVAVSVSSAVLPWLILVLNTFSFGVGFIQKIRSEVVASPLPLTKKLVLLK